MANAVKRGETLFMVIEIFTDGRVVIDGKEVSDEKDPEELIRKYLTEVSDTPEPLGA